MNEHTPVLIVGAGPVGLALAGELGWRGIACTLIEKTDGAIEQPRMDIVGPRTMAQLDDALGVLGRSLDDDARAACDELVHPGNAVSDFHNTTGWIKSTLD